MSDVLREKIARALIADIQRQTDNMWPVERDDLHGLVDEELDFPALADAILELPEIKEALAAKAWQEFNDGLG